MPDQKEIFPACQIVSLSPRWVPFAGARLAAPRRALDALIRDGMLFWNPSIRSVRLSTSSSCHTRRFKIEVCLGLSATAHSHIQIETDSCQLREAIQSNERDLEPSGMLLGIFVSFCLITSYVLEFLMFQDHVTCLRTS